MTGDVAVVRESDGYKDIVAVMRRRHVSAVPVFDVAGHLAGVVSEADLLLKEIGGEAQGGYLISTGRRGGAGEGCRGDCGRLDEHAGGDDRARRKRGGRGEADA